MKNFLKSTKKTGEICVNWYKNRIKESKLYLISLVFDIILMPIKVVAIVIGMLFSKDFCNLVIDTWEEIVEEVEG